MNDFRAIALPYCLKRMKDGSYVILNRKYKPIGFDTSTHLVYEDYPICHKLRGINKRTAAILSWNNSSDIEMIYLYDDSCVPTRSSANMNRYLKKIETLAKYKITDSSARIAWSV